METHSKRPRTNSFSPRRNDSDDKSTLLDEDALHLFGYDKKKSLAEASDDRGDLWVHEKCATWTGATANKNENLSVTNLVSKALATVNNIYRNAISCSFYFWIIWYNKNNGITRFCKP